MLIIPFFALNNAIDLVFWKKSPQFFSFASAHSALLSLTGKAGQIYRQSEHQRCR